MLKRTYLRLVEMQEEQARQHLEEGRSIHNEMRGYKHDFHHHLQALKGQLEAGQVDRAIAYLEQLDRSLQTVDTLLKTGNVTVDAILSAKLAQARAAGIAVTAEANLPPELSLTDLELSIVIGNLLDNAIEGCRSAAGEKFLRLSLRMKGDMLYFYLLNSAGKKQKKVGSLFRTGKTERFVQFTEFFVKILYDLVDRGFRGTYDLPFQGFEIVLFFVHDKIDLLAKTVQFLVVWFQPVADGNVQSRNAGNGFRKRFVRLFATALILLFFS